VDLYSASSMDLPNALVSNVLRIFCAENYQNRLNADRVNPKQTKYNLHKFRLDWLRERERERERERDFISTWCRRDKTRVLCVYRWTCWWVAQRRRPADADRCSRGRGEVCCPDECKAILHHRRNTFAEPDSRDADEPQNNSDKHTSVTPALVSQ